MSNVVIHTALPGLLVTLAAAASAGCDLSSEGSIDGAYVARTVNKTYRSTPLRGLWQHPPYFHDGSAATLDEVVEHYDATLALTAGERADLVGYLKTL